MNWTKLAFASALLPLAATGLGEYAGAQYALDNYEKRHVPAVLAGGAVGAGLGSLFLRKPLTKALTSAIRGAQRMGLTEEAADILASDVAPYLAGGIAAPSIGLAAGIPLAAEISKAVSPESWTDKVRRNLGEMVEP